MKARYLKIAKLPTQRAQANDMQQTSIGPARSTRRISKDQIGSSTIRHPRSLFTTLFLATLVAFGTSVAWDVAKSAGSHPLTNVHGAVSSKGTASPQETYNPTDEAGKYAGVSDPFSAGFLDAGRGSNPASAHETGNPTEDAGRYVGSHHSFSDDFHIEH